MSSLLRHVCVSEYELINSPSRADGISEEIETELRSFGCEMIDDAGVLLELPQIAIATAQTLFHRFFCTQSFAENNVEVMAIASIFLAAKLEECSKTMRSAISVFVCIKLRRLKQEKGILENEEISPSPVLNISTMFFHQLRQSVLKSERLLLEKLGFNTCVELPHKFLLNYLNVLQLAKHPKLPQQAWNYMNDSMRTVACVRFRPEVIATAAIYMAALKLEPSLPMHEAPTPWWTLFDADLVEMDHICWLLTQLYDHPTPTYQHVLKDPNQVQPNFDEFFALTINAQTDPIPQPVTITQYSRTNPR